MVLRAAPCTLLCALTLSLLAGCGRRRGRSRGQAVGDGVALAHEDTAEPDAFGGRADPTRPWSSRPRHVPRSAEPDAFRGQADPDAVGVAEAVAYAEPVAEPDED